MLHSTEFNFVALPGALVQGFRSGQADANGQSPQRLISDGNGNPCRHCLTNIPANAELLLLAHRPFPVVHAYTELGPVFVCAEDCERHHESDVLPPMFAQTKAVIARGYDESHRIVGGTGQMVDMEKLEATMTDILQQPAVRYLHLRSISNNCYFCRVEYREAA